MLPITHAHLRVGRSCSPFWLTQPCRTSSRGHYGAKEKCRQQERPFCWSCLHKQRAAVSVGKRIQLRCAAESAGQQVRVVEEGDVVSVRFIVKPTDQEFEVEQNEPLTFQIGVSSTVGNPLYQIVDSAVRGLAVGETAVVQVDGKPWDKDRVFRIPFDHPEVQRLEGRYKNQGGLHEGLVVELLNGDSALVLKRTDVDVLLDTNSMFAGHHGTFEFEVLSIEDAATPSTQ